MLVADKKFHKVMREFKEGKLYSGDKKVTDKKQAIAIAFSEARKLNSKKYHLTAENGMLLRGPSHEDGGIAGIIKESGQRVEVEGDEMIINKNSTRIKDHIVCRGTGEGIGSALNELGGGKKWSSEGTCEVTEEIEQFKDGNKMKYRTEYQVNVYEKNGDLRNSPIFDSKEGAEFHAKELSEKLGYRTEIIPLRTEVKERKKLFGIFAKGVKISSRDMRDYVARTAPFRGEGHILAENVKGSYVVYSYGYYPLLVFKNGQWYENKEKYSKTTSKQLSQSRPSGISPEYKTTSELEDLIGEKRTQSSHFYKKGDKIKFRSGEKLLSSRDFIGSRELKDKAQSHIDKGETVIPFNYTDYGGSFFDIVVIEYFKKKHPKSIVSESTAYDGQNAFIFGEEADNFIEANKNYPLGYEDIEDFYYEKQNEKENESFEFFLDSLKSDGYVIDEKAIEWLNENKGGYYNMTTQGLDFSYEDLTNELIEEGLISKEQEEAAKGKKISSHINKRKNESLRNIQRMVIRDGKMKKAEEGLKISPDDKFIKVNEPENFDIVMFLNNDNYPKRLKVFKSGDICIYRSDVTLISILDTYGIHYTEFDNKEEVDNWLKKKLPARIQNKL